MIGHCSRSRENDDLPLRRGPVVKKKPPFSSAHGLITREIMRSRDAQCNTGEWPVCSAKISLKGNFDRFERFWNSSLNSQNWSH